MIAILLESMDLIQKINEAGTFEEFFRGVQTLCVVLGAAFGFVAGVLSASFGAPGWIAWLIGIVSAVALIFANLEQRKSEV